MHINNFYQYSKFKRDFGTHHREPFFQIAMNYARLTGKEKPVIADIGSGEGDFYSYLSNNKFPVENVYLLDSNPKTVESNKQRLTRYSVHYLAPAQMPFEGGSVDLIHTSHMIEYLTPTEIYPLMIEMDRVLADGGYLVVSAPLFWSDFYDDLGHLRPYNPRVFYKYLVEMYRNPRLEKVSGDYEFVDLVYRYHQLPLDEGWSSTIPALDYTMISVKRLLGKMGFRKLHRNGYTLVIRKRKTRVNG